MIALLLGALLSAGTVDITEECKAAAAVSAGTCARLAFEAQESPDTYGPICMHAGAAALLLCAQTPPDRTDCRKLSAWYRATIETACEESDDSEVCEDWGEEAEAVLGQLCREVIEEGAL